MNHILIILVRTVHCTVPVYTIFRKEHKNSCSKMWLIDQLYIKLGIAPLRYSYLMSDSDPKQFTKEVCNRAVTLSWLILKDSWKPCYKFLKRELILNIFTSFLQVHSIREHLFLARIMEKYGWNIWLASKYIFEF